jgi:cyclohexanecarboxyl-CoA dehydrogenase
VDFSLTEEQTAFAAKIRAFVDDRLLPRAHEADRTGRFADGLMAEFGAQGLFGLRVPERFGGLDLDAVTTGVIMEELARGDLTACYPVLNAALVAGIIQGNCSEAQQQAWLPAIASGEAIVAFCMTEAAHGTDAAAVELRAEPDGDGWRLTGEKTSIMLGGVATHGLIFARTSDAPRAKGVTVFYASLDDPAVTRTVLNDLGSRSGGRATLTFDGLRVSADQTVGGPGLGFAQGMRGFDYSRALIALMAIAVANASLAEAIEHARTRQAFDAPLGTFQGIAFPLAEHATYLHAARLLAFEALWRNDQGLDHRIEANMSKWWAPKASVEAAHQALLTLGHLGWNEDGDMARRLRDVIGTQLADGTANATKLVVSRMLLGRESAP